MPHVALQGAVIQLPLELYRVGSSVVWPIPGVSLGLAHLLTIQRRDPFGLSVKLLSGKEATASTGDGAGAHFYAQLRGGVLPAVWQCLARAPLAAVPVPLNKSTLATSEVATEQCLVSGGVCVGVGIYSRRI